MSDVHKNDGLQSSEYFGQSDQLELYPTLLKLIEGKNLSIVIGEEGDYDGNSFSC